MKQIKPMLSCRPPAAAASVFRASDLAVRPPPGRPGGSGFGRRRFTARGGGGREASEFS